jgi:hypothetical protein
MSRTTKILTILVVVVWEATMCNVLAARFGPSINIPLVVFGAIIACVGLVILSDSKAKKKSDNYDKGGHSGLSPSARNHGTASDR